ncbi:MAG TPA: S1/P1 nuclease [Steroidobacteraceae bacterium]|nr:S1/P1 nuclease [Steroidobacteraceae bacterium]
MRSFPALIRGIVLLLSCAPCALAWGPQGHRTVGAIADRLLTPAARAQVAQLLAGDLDKFGNPSGRGTLESVAVWADEIRGTPADEPRWHYDDVPLCGSAPRDSYCPGGQCNSAQLERLTAVLADARAEPRARNEALKWIVHLVGDLHQPLHAADNGDLGGNRVHVALAGVHTRGRLTLHGAWDSELVALALHTRSRQQPPRDIEALALEARTLTAEAGQGTPAGWASQSNHLARNVAYQYPGFACGSVPAGIVMLDGDYQQEAEAIVRERLLLAGGRLANLLNETLVTR